MRVAASLHSKCTMHSHTRALLLKASACATASGHELLRVVANIRSRRLAVFDSPRSASVQGVDGLFVLQAALDNTPEDMPMAERMAATLSSAGVSVTVASLTNFAAFAIGSNTSLPALRAFSLYAAFALLADLLLQVRCCWVCACASVQHVSCMRAVATYVMQPNDCVTRSLCANNTEKGRPNTQSV